MGARPVRRAAKGSRLTTVEGDGNLDSLDQVSPSVLTINGDAITITGPGTYHLLPETGTADSLSTINGAEGREWKIVLCTNVVGHVITVNASNHLRMERPGGATTFTLDSLYDTIVFQDIATAVWRELHRKSIPA